MKALLIILAVFLAPLAARAAEDKAAPACAATDKACLLDMLDQSAATINEEQWRDSTYRELAKLLTLDKQSDKAVALIGRIKNPDTKAMTIRGIGMAVSKTDMTKEQREALFARLSEEAAKIEHAPSHAIALTYISMSQAFAGDNDAAMKTAAGMDNQALRNKAYGEAGEVQAERDEIDAVLISVAAIDDPAYRDKEQYIISKVFTDRKYFDHALQIARAIKDNYQRSQALLYILVKQITPEEVSIE